MSRYIDIEFLRATMLNDRLLQGNAEWTLYQQEVDKWLKKIPSIDIVRCEECRHKRLVSSDEGTSFYWCKRWNLSTDDDAFCSYGERREP